MIEFISIVRHKNEGGWDPVKDPYPRPGMIAVEMDHWLPRLDHNLSWPEYCEKYEVVELREMSYLDWIKKDELKPKKKRAKKIKQPATKKVKLKSIEVSAEPGGVGYEMYVLEFDWDYGHEKEEVESISAAKARRKQWESTFVAFEFTNWKLSKEIRYKEEIEF